MFSFVFTEIDEIVANFTNCIIDGSLSTEVSFQEQELGEFNYTFDHCLIKLDPTIDIDNEDDFLLAEIIAKKIENNKTKFSAFNFCRNIKFG